MSSVKLIFPRVDDISLQTPGQHESEPLPRQAPRRRGSIAKGQPWRENVKEGVALFTGVQGAAFILPEIPDDSSTDQDESSDIMEIAGRTIQLPTLHPPTRNILYRQNMAPDPQLEVSGQDIPVPHPKAAAQPKHAPMQRWASSDSFLEECEMFSTDPHVSLRAILKCHAFGVPVQIVRGTSSTKRRLARPMFHCRRCLDHWEKKGKLPPICADPEKLVRGPVIELSKNEAKYIRNIWHDHLAPKTFGAGHLAEQEEREMISRFKQLLGAKDSAERKYSSSFMSLSDSSSSGRSSSSSNSEPPLFMLDDDGQLIPFTKSKLLKIKENRKKTQGGQDLILLDETGQPIEVTESKLMKMKKHKRRSRERREGRKDSSRRKSDSKGEIRKKKHPKFREEDTTGSEQDEDMHGLKTTKGKHRKKHRYRPKKQSYSDEEELQSDGVESYMSLTFSKSNVDAEDHHGGAHKKTHHKRHRRRKTKHQGNLEEESEDTKRHRRKEKGNLEEESEDTKRHRRKEKGDTRHKDNLKSQVSLPDAHKKKSTSGGQYDYSDGDSDSDDDMFILPGKLEGQSEESYTNMLTTLIQEYERQHVWEQEQGETFSTHERQIRNSSNQNLMHSKGGKGAVRRESSRTSGGQPERRQTKPKAVGVAKPNVSSGSSSHHAQAAPRTYSDRRVDIQKNSSKSLITPNMTVDNNTYGQFARTSRRSSVSMYPGQPFLFGQNKSGSVRDVKTSTLANRQSSKPVILNTLVHNKVGKPTTTQGKLRDSVFTTGNNSVVSSGQHPGSQAQMGSDAYQEEGREYSQTGNLRPRGMSGFEVEMPEEQGQVRGGTTKRRQSALKGPKPGGERNRPRQAYNSRQLSDAKEQQVSSNLTVVHKRGSIRPEPSAASLQYNASSLQQHIPGGRTPSKIFSKHTIACAPSQHGYTTTSTSKAQSSQKAAFPQSVHADGSGKPSRPVAEIKPVSQTTSKSSVSSASSATSAHSSDSASSVLESLGQLLNQQRRNAIVLPNLDGVSILSFTPSFSFSVFALPGQYQQAYEQTRQAVANPSAAELRQRQSKAPDPKKQPPPKKGKRPNEMTRINRRMQRKVNNPKPIAKYVKKLQPVQEERKQANSKVRVETQIRALHEETIIEDGDEDEGEAVNETHADVDVHTEHRDMSVGNLQLHETDSVLIRVEDIMH